MAVIRIRLSFARSLLNKAEQCWMLVDTSTCKLVHDLEYLIRKKFFVDEECFILNLYLDDFLLPSQEQIEVIRDNDVIRVKEDKVQLSKKEKSVKSCYYNDVNPKKRKLDGSSDSKKKHKKMKHSPTSTKDIKEGNTAKFRERLKDKQKQSSSKSSNNKNNCQKAVDFLHKVSQDFSKKISSGKTTGDNATQKKKKLEQSTLKNKLKLKPSQSSLEKQNKTSIPKQPIIAPGNLGASEEKAKSENKKLDKGVPTINGGVEKMTNGKKLKGKTVNINEQSASLSKSEYSLSVSSATSSSNVSSASDDSDDNIAQKNTLNGKDVGETNKPKTSSKNINGTTVPQKQKTGYQSNQGTGAGSHIRFDNDNEAEVCVTRPPILPHPNIQSVQQMNTASNTQSPHLSPIYPVSKNNICSKEKRLPLKGNEKNRNYRKDNCEKDVYTNKSNIMESTRVEKQPQEPDANPGDDLPTKDFALYPLLHGPPRVGETVAYKILELSQSYTPELSKYKEGKVLSFDASVNMLKLKLTKESLSRATGDGHISLKFELIDINEDDEEPVIPVFEIPVEVEVQWSSMIEPRLVAPGL